MAARPGRQAENGKRIRAARSTEKVTALGHPSHVGFEHAHVEGFCQNHLTARVHGPLMMLGEGMGSDSDHHRPAKQRI
jgi:hypothetical protein